jgi:hypothetical protein
VLLSAWTRACGSAPPTIAAFDVASAFFSVSMNDPATVANPFSVLGPRTGLRHQGRTAWV